MRRAFVLILAVLAVVVGTAAPAAALDRTGKWYQGWELNSRTLCMESTIPGISLYFVSNELAKVGVVAPVSAVRGGCAARGYAAHERVIIRDMTAAELVSPRYADMCAGTDPWLYGPNYVHSVEILVRRTGYAQTACGDGLEWRDLGLHEVLHVLGLSHEQTSVSSAMRDGHVLSWEDQYLLRWLYSAKPLRVKL